MADAIPDGLPDGTAETVIDGFAAASAVADGLPDAVGGLLSGSAQDAFLTGMNVVTAASAVVLVGIAVLVARAPRHVPPLGQEAPADTADAPEVAAVGRAAAGGGE
ncbi:hypothetical protein AB0L25_14050 [Spirillospora sp. NPDC052242]